MSDMASPNSAGPTVSSLNELQDALTTTGVVRRRWAWSTIGKKSKENYPPWSVGKWWFDYYQECQGIPDLEKRASHICRIMESDLGVQLFGDQVCDACRAEGAECWVYSEKGRGQVWHPGSACARCRSRGPKDGGCSVSKRKPSARRDPSYQPPPRNILPKKRPNPGTLPSNVPPEEEPNPETLPSNTSPEEEPNPETSPSNISIKEEPSP